MVLEINNLCKKYNSKNLVLKNCSFNLEPETCLGIIGKNGAGKSTFLKIITGLVKQSSGEIQYMGHSKLNEEIKKKIGFYLGKEYLPDEMTGMQFLQLINLLYRPQNLLPKEALLSLVSYFFENSADANNLIRNFSFGMCQKIGICSSLLTQPELLILDEPFAGLDAFAANNLIKVMNKYKQNHSIIISSHDLHYLEKVCDQLLVLDNGKIIYNGSLEDFTSNGNSSIQESLFKVFVSPDHKQEALDWLK